MPTAIQKRPSLAAQAILAQHLTLGHSESSVMVGREIERVYEHVSLLNQGVFNIGYYSPFPPRRSFRSKVRYKFSGRTSPLPFSFDE